MSKDKKMTDQKTVIDEKAFNEKLKAERQERKKFILAKGKGIMCRRGVLGPGDEVKPEYLAGGEASFKTLEENGFFE